MGFKNRTSYIHGKFRSLIIDKNVILVSYVTILHIIVNIIWRL